jgi:peroxiredoxin Q/BCP
MAQSDNFVSQRLVFEQVFYPSPTGLLPMEKQIELAEGASAPDFTFRHKDGKTAKLSDLRGKDVVVYFYPKDFTPGCTTEAMEFSRDYSKFKDAGIEIVGVSPDGEQSHQKFREKMGILYPLVADPEHDLSKKYGVYGLKSFMGREYMGVNRSTFLINKKGKIAKIFKKVKPAGHTQELLHALRG